MYRSAAHCLTLSLLAFCAPAFGAGQAPPADVVTTPTITVSAARVPTPEEVFAIPADLRAMLQKQVIQRSYSATSACRRSWR